MKLFNQNNIVKGYFRSILIDYYNSSYLFKNDESLVTKIKFITEKNKIDFVKYDSINWMSPSIISNCILTISHENKLFKTLNFNSILSILQNFICKHIVIYYLDSFTINDIKNHTNSIEKFNIQSLLIICNYQECYYSDEFGEMIMNFKLFVNVNVIILGCPFDKNIEDTIFFSRIEKVFKFDKKLSEFKVHHELYTESQNHNTYLNRKLYISPSGEIKNAPETEQTFGYIQDIKSENELKQIISTPAFQKYWFIHKGLIDVCKECEFRHMCVDNRIPIERTKDEWFHTLECNYNPYIAKWEGEEGYKALKECGVISNETGFTINHKKIKQLNLKMETENS